MKKIEWRRYRVKTREELHRMGKYARGRFFLQGLLPGREFVGYKGRFGLVKDAEADGWWNEDMVIDLGPVPLPSGESPVSSALSTCTCNIHSLMREGCQCGFLERGGHV